MESRAFGWKKSLNSGILKTKKKIRHMKKMGMNAEVLFYEHLLERLEKKRHGQQ